MSKSIGKKIKRESNKPTHFLMILMIQGQVWGLSSEKVQSTRLIREELLPEVLVKILFQLF